MMEVWTKEFEVSICKQSAMEAGQAMTRACAELEKSETRLLRMAAWVETQRLEVCELEAAQERAEQLVSDNKEELKSFKDRIRRPPSCSPPADVMAEAKAQAKPPWSKQTPTKRQRR